MRDVPPDKTCPYACEDADITLRLADTLAGRLKEDDLLEIAEQIEFPLLRVLADMEITGIRVDPEMLAALSEEIGAHIRDLEQKVYKEAGETFNIGSTRQLGHILFEKLNLPVVSKTPTGAPSTKEDVLETLAAKHPLPALILEWRQFSKLKSTYVDSLGKLIHPDTGRIHTNYNQDGGSHREAFLRGTEPAKHSNPDRQGQGNSQGVRRQKGVEVAFVRLHTD